ncbi:MAG: type II secretion system F family protein [Halobacteriota archaeon]
MSDGEPTANPAEAAAGGFDSDRETKEVIPVPKYESEQYLPRAEHIRGARKSTLRKEFGYIRTYFKSRPENHYTLQRKLNQARYGTTYDIYLTRTVWYALGAALLGAILGLIIGYAVAQAGWLAGLSSPFGTPSGGIARDVVLFLAANKVAIGGGVITLVLAAMSGMTAWYGRYYYPYTVVDSRRRNINITLPHVIVYMYALSFGGMDFVEVLKRTSRTQNIYGEVANEFDMIIKDTELFGSDLYTALRNARNLTPSDNMERFFDDMLSVLDSGGDMTDFLHGESRKYMDEAVREQESFLDTLETLSEVFVVGFVAAPLFLIVMLLMMSFLGSNTLPMLYVIIYAVLPLGMFGFLVLIATLSEPYRQPDHELDPSERDPEFEPSPELRRFPGYHIFQGLKLRRKLRAFLSNPTRDFKRNPEYTLAITVPLALIVFLYLWFVMDVSLDSFFENAFVVGTLLLVVPFLIVALPLAAFYEVERRRKQSVTQRLPDMLDILASSNQMGVSFVDGLGMVSRNLTGSFAEELKRVRNDIRWNGDVHNALISMARRLQVPQLTRTSYILAEGSRSSGELYKLLSIAAEDTRQRYRLERNRRQNLQAYTTIVVIGFLVYLAVIVILDYSFLGAIEEALAGTDADDLGPITIDLDEIATYNALFYHSALIMAVGTGLISGKLTDNSVLSGLKYSVGLVLLCVLVFLFI